MFRRHLAMVATAAVLLCAYAPLAQAQQTGGFALEIPEVRNFATLAVGTVPDYVGSDDTIIGVAPAVLISFGDTERWTRNFENLMEEVVRKHDLV